MGRRRLASESLNGERLTVCKGPDCGVEIPAFGKNGVRRKFCSGSCKNAWLAKVIRVGTEVLDREATAP